MGIFAAIGAFFAEMTPMGWVMLAITAASMIYQRQQAVKMRERQQAAAEAAKGFQVVQEGNAVTLPVVYGRAVLGGVRVYANTYRKYFGYSNGAYTSGTTQVIHNDSDGIDTFIHQDRPAGAGGGNYLFGANNIDSIADGKYHFLATQQAICIGGINKCYQVDVNDVLYTDAKYDPGHKIVFHRDGGTVCEAMTKQDYLEDEDIRIGMTCKIVTAGNTNWTALGASSNSTGTEFVATANGNGLTTTGGFTTRHNSKFTGAAYATGIFILNRDNPQYSGVPDLKFYVEGMKIRTITCVDGKYSVSNTLEYSNNPALVLYDYLTNRTYGRGLDPAEIDLESFYVASKVCDLEVMASVSSTGKFWRARQGATESVTTVVPGNASTVWNSATVKYYNKDINGANTTLYASMLVNSSGVPTAVLDSTGASGYITSGTNVGFIQADGTYDTYIPTGTLYSIQDSTHTQIGLAAKNGTSLAFYRENSRVYFSFYPFPFPMIGENGAAISSISEQSSASTHSIKLYEFNGALDTGASIRDNINEILRAMGDCDFIWSNGKYKLQVIYPNVLTTLPVEVSPGIYRFAASTTITNYARGLVIQVDYTEGDVEQSELYRAYTHTNISSPALNTIDFVKHTVDITDDDLLREQPYVSTWPSAQSRLNHCKIRYRNEAKDFSDDVASWPPKYGKVEGSNRNRGAWVSGDAIAVAEEVRHAAALAGTSPYTTPDQNDILDLTKVESGRYNVSEIVTYDGSSYQLTSNFVNWSSTTNPSIATADWTLYTGELNTVYKIYKAEDNEMTLESEEFVGYCTDYQHALAIAEQNVRLSRSKVNISISVTMDNWKVEPGDIVKINSVMLDIPGEIYRVISVKFDEKNFITWELEKYDAAQLAWNVADDNPGHIRNVYDFELKNVMSGLNFSIIEGNAENSSGRLSWNAAGIYYDDSHNLAGIMDDRVTSYIVQYTTATLGEISDGTATWIFIGRASTLFYDLPSMYSNAYYFTVVATDGKHLAPRAGWPLYSLDANMVVPIKPNTKTFYCYKRSATEIVVAPTGGTYDFTYDTLDYTTLTAGWSLLPLDGKDDLYRSKGTATKLTAVSIQVITWEIPEKFSTSPTTPIEKPVSIAIYKAASSIPSTPTGGTYDFSTNVLSDIPAGWATSAPSALYDIWVSSDLLYKTIGTGIFSDFTWSTPVVYNEAILSADLTHSDVYVTEYSTGVRSYTDSNGTITTDINGTDVTATTSFTIYSNSNCTAYICHTDGYVKDQAGNVTARLGATLGKYYVDVLDTGKYNGYFIILSSVNGKTLQTYVRVLVNAVSGYVIDYSAPLTPTGVSVTSDYNVIFISLADELGYTTGNGHHHTEVYGSYINSWSESNTKYLEFTGRYGSFSAPLNASPLYLWVRYISKDGASWTALREDSIPSGASLRYSPSPITVGLISNAKTQSGLIDAILAADAGGNPIIESQLAAATAAYSGLANKLNNSSDDTLGGTVSFNSTGAFKIGNPVWTPPVNAGETGSATGTGIFYNEKGIVAVSSGNIKFVLDGVHGNAIFGGALNAATGSFAGSLTAASGTFGEITIAASGSISSGQTAYNTGNGFWLGYASGYTKLSIGNSDAGLTYDSSTGVTTFKGDVDTTGKLKVIGSWATPVVGYNAAIYGGSTTSNTNGVMGNSSTNSGVFGYTTGTGGGIAGVQGWASSVATNSCGVIGDSDASSAGHAAGAGGRFESTNGDGVYGKTSISNTSRAGIYGKAPAGGIAIYGDNSGSGYAGYFNGNVYVGGTLTATNVSGGSVSATSGSFSSTLSTSSGLKVTGTSYTGTGLEFVLVTNGAAGSLAGYLVIYINGTERRIPCYTT